MQIDQGPLVVFLVAVPLAIFAAVGFGVAICRGTRKERRQRAA